MSPSSQNLAGPFGLTRRTWLAAALLLGARHAGAAATTLPAAKSLRDELASALRSGNPLVVLVSLAGCPFCAALRQHYLGPMRAQQDLPMVQLDMRSAAAVQDFNGTASTHDALVRAWNVPLAPTVLFFGRAGVEVAPRLAGAASPDFYGAYLDERLAQARATFRSP